MEKIAKSETNANFGGYTLSQTLIIDTKTMPTL